MASRILKKNGGILRSRMRLIRKSILILTGEGSKILDKNSIYLENNFKFFNEMNFFEENSETICISGYNFNKKNHNHEVKIIPKKIKKYGFFEKLFHIFN